MWPKPTQATSSLHMRSKTLFYMLWKTFVSLELKITFLWWAPAHKSDNTFFEDIKNTRLFTCDVTLDSLHKTCRVEWCDNGQAYTKKKHKNNLAKNLVFLCVILWWSDKLHKKELPFKQNMLSKSLQGAVRINFPVTIKISSWITIPFKCMIKWRF